MNADEGDGDCVMELTIQFDDAEIDTKNLIQQVANPTTAVKQNNGLLGFLGLGG